MALSWMDGYPPQVLGHYRACHIWASVKMAHRRRTWTVPGEMALGNCASWCMDPVRQFVYVYINISVFISIGEHRLNMGK
jgi:hypothetical protein